MSDYILLTKDNVHDQPIASFEVKEDFFSDGRSYVAEVWDSAGIGMVTYYFSAKGFDVNELPAMNDMLECDDDMNEHMLDYLIAEHKLTNDDPRMYIETYVYYVQSEAILSVTVAVADNSIEDDILVFREYKL